tara:strand:- start:382 stop:624 length:243 start_codon:yes stop_codon:yes gene_type:complete
LERAFIKSATKGAWLCKAPKLNFSSLKKRKWLLWLISFWKADVLKIFLLNSKLEGRGSSERNPFFWDCVQDFLHEPLSLQ